jgi:hypothetical protein
VREGVPAVAVNTVLRAHRDPERRGRVSALAGPDGAGQSALLRILARQASPAGRMACVQDGTPRQDPDGAGLDEDRITALCTGALRDFHWRRGGLADHAGAAGSETEGVA